MQEQKRLQELIKESIQSVYAAPTDGAALSALKKHIEDWDVKEYPGKEEAGGTIAENLQSLINFLEKKGLKPQSDEVFRIMLYTFPESHFSAAPVQAKAPHIDIASLKTANLGLEDDEDITEARTAIDLFEKHYRLVVQNLEHFSREVEMKLFRELGTGDAGELYRRFKRVAEALDKSSVKDAPWGLMNQLALQLNNSQSAFNEAYVLLHEVSEIKTATPSEALAPELEKNKIFFLRNYYWKRIDDAVAKGDNSSVVFYIDKLMPMAQGGHEKSNLLMLRANAVKRNDEPVKGCVSIFAGVVILMLVLSLLFSSGPAQKGKEKTPSRWQAFWQNVAPKTESELALSFGSGQNKIRVINKAGLDEIKPPDQPTDRKLNLAEVRHIIFQKARLEHLKQQELTPEEEEMIQKLWEEWRKRGEFYKYDAEDRERAEIEAQRNMQALLEDAEEIKKELASSAQDLVEDGKEGEEDGTEEPAPQFEQHKLLLNLENPVHVKRIIAKLAHYGYFKGDINDGTWNSRARKALIDFKVARMSLLDDKWDIKTQEALLGR